MVTIYYRHYDPCPRNEQYKTEHRIGLELLSHGLKHLYNLDMTPALLEDELVKGDVGKPYLKTYPDIHFNITHCPQLVMCGFDEAPLGLDAEKFDSFPKSIFRRTLSEEEKMIFQDCDPETKKDQQLFYCYWTLKESWIKQSGKGLTQKLTDSSFRVEGLPDQIEVHSNLSNLYFNTFLFEDCYAVSICTSHKTDYRIISHDEN